MDGTGHSELESSVTEIADLRPGDHLCCIHKTKKEHRNVVTPFIRGGLEGNQKVIYIVDANTAEEILDYLRNIDYPPEPYIEKGQLVLLTRDQSYVRGGSFDPDAMIELLEKETKKALEEGFDALRVTGEMTWALRGHPGSDRLMEYENKLNRFFPRHQALGLCQYDRTEFDPEVLLGVLRTHPIAVIGDETYENFHFIPPKKLLGENPKEAELRSWEKGLEQSKGKTLRLEHVNSLLRSIRDVNQIIVQEEEIETIMRKACESLLETRDYLGINLALAGEKGGNISPMIQVGEHDYDQSFSVSTEGKGNGPACIKESISSGRTGVISSKEDGFDCADCSYGTPDDHATSLSAPMVSEDEVIGVLQVWMVPKVRVDREEKDLLKEVAGDLALAWEKARTETRLKQERNFLHKLAEASPVAITEVDKDGNIIFANDRAEEVFSLEKSEIVDRKYNDVDWQITDFAGESYPDEELPFEVVKETGEPVFDVRHAIEWPDGERKLLSVSASPLFDEDGEFDGSISVIEDITEEVETQKELEKSKERYRMLFERMNEGAALHELVTDDKGKPVDYRIMAVNSNFESIIGLKKDQILKKKATEAYGEEEAPYLERYAEVATTGEPIRFETYYQSMDKYFEISVFSPQEGKFATVFTDITKRKKAEEKKGHLNSLLRSIRDINQLIVKEDNKDRLIQSVCDTLLETRGYEHVWLILLEGPREHELAAHAGFDEDLQQLRDFIEEGGLPGYAKKALAEPDAVVTQDPSFENEEKISDKVSGLGVVTARLEYDGDVYGLLSASMLPHLVDNEEEQDLLEEVAGDVALGMHDLESSHQLKRRESQLRRSQEVANVGSWTIDLETGELDWSTQAYHIFGVTEGQHVDYEDFLGFIHPDDREFVDEEWQKALKGGEYEVEHRILVDGKTKWVREKAEVKFDERGEASEVIGSVQDITQRKKATDKLKKQEREMSILLSNLPGMAYRCKNNKKWTMDFVSEGCEDLTGYEAEKLVGDREVSYGALIEEEDREKVWETVQENLNSRQPFELEYRITTKSGKQKWVWEQGRGVFTEDGELENLQGFITDISERKRVKQKLRQSFVELAETTSRVLGVRDPYTQKHELRVGELASAVGEKMGLSEDKLRGLYIGGVLHDIGKIVVPETILTKPGELKDVEWEMIRSHSEVGYNQILADTDFPWPVAEMTLHHHERLDGSGYPDGLSGNELTTEVKILGACDMVEAMSTRRPYREARSKERTVDVLKEESGDRLDPEIVDILLKMIEEGEISFGGAI